MSAVPRRLTRLPDKQSRDISELQALLADTYLGHIAFTVDGEVSVAPTAVALFEDQLVWHGSTGSGWMRALADGVPVAVAVTTLDAVVVARSRFESSFRYRSAVVRGTPVALSGPAKERALDALLERLLPGRLAETRDSHARELAATLVLALPVEDWVLKVSDKWPEDTEADLAGDAWAGVLPLRTVLGPALPAPDLRDGIDVPLSVRRLLDS